MKRSIWQFVRGIFKKEMAQDMGGIYNCPLCGCILTENYVITHANYHNAMRHILSFVDIKEPLDKPKEDLTKMN